MIQLIIQNPAHEKIPEELIYLLLDKRKNQQQELLQQTLLDALKQAEITVKIDDLKLDEIVIEPVVRAAPKKIYYNKKSKYFYVNIYYNKKKHYAGYYKTEAEALEAYTKKAQELGML